MFDFRRITLFCLGYRLSKQNVTIVPEIWENHGAVATPQGNVSESRSNLQNSDHCRKNVQRIFLHTEWKMKLSGMKVP